MHKIPIRHKLCLILLSLILCMVILEFGLRIAGLVFLTLGEHKNKILSEEKNRYTILCLGESTTAMGGEYSWPVQLERILNEEIIGTKFKVVNKGVIGIQTSGILSRLEYSLDKYKPNMVIVMMGINDDSGTAFCYEKKPFTKNLLAAKNFRTYKLATFIWSAVKNKWGGGRRHRIKDNTENHMDDLEFNYIAKEILELKESIKINPNKEESYIRLASIYLGQGISKEAEALLKIAIRINPKSGMAYAILGRLCPDKCMEVAQANSASLGDSDKYFLIAECYLEGGRYREAEEMYQKTIEVSQKHILAYTNLLYCYMSQNKMKEAEGLIKEAMERGIKGDTLYRYIANFYLEKGDYQEADKYFDEPTSVLNYRATRFNYRKLQQIVTQRGIRLVCVQYPMREIKELKQLFGSVKGIVFVDNKNTFKEVLKNSKYSDYFTDYFAVDLGHCTPKGNRLLAESIANVILRECLGYYR